MKTHYHCPGNSVTDCLRPLKDAKSTTDKSLVTCKTCQKTYTFMGVMGVGVGNEIKESPIMSKTEMNKVVHPNLTAPAALSKKGKEAVQKVLDVMAKHGCNLAEDVTGGCPAFRTPKEWAARGESYGLKSVVIVVHDGGDVGNYFSFDREQYNLVEEVNAALGEIGLYAEQCTCWYSAIYPI